MQLQPSGVAVRSGVITGIIIGMLSLPVIALSGVGVGGAGLRFLFAIIALIACGAAGFVATRRSGLIRSGVGAGLLAAAVATFIAICLGIVILIALAPHAAVGTRLAQTPLRLRRALFRGAIVRLFLGSLYLLIAGAIGGVIGGLLGRIGQRRPQPQTASAPPFTPPPASSPAGYAAGGYPPPPSPPVAPQPYYPPTQPYDDNTPTTVLPPSQQP